MSSNGVEGNENRIGWSKLTQVTVKIQPYLLNKFQKFLSVPQE